MASSTIWVKAVDGRAQFYQDVIGDDGKLKSEHVRAETIGGEQVPIPVEVTRTIAVMQALNERLPLSNPPAPARIVECDPDEVEAFLAQQGKVGEPEAKPKSKGKGGNVASGNAAGNAAGDGDGDGAGDAGDGGDENADGKGKGKATTGSSASS